MLKCCKSIGYFNCKLITKCQGELKSLDQKLLKRFTNPKWLLYSFALIFALVMLWHPLEVYIDWKVNWFITKQNTFEQHPKWYAFFTQSNLEGAFVVIALYYNLRTQLTNAKFLLPFVLYNVWCIFEYWLFAFAVDRYVILIVVILSSIILHESYKPKRRT